jgi:hypothetical protein
VEIINKKRFLLCFILTFIFLSTNVVNSHFFKALVNDNTPSIVYAGGSRSAGGGYKSSSFSAPKTSSKSSSSSSKSSSGGFKSGGFSNTAPKSGSSSSNNYSSGSKNSYIPIPIPFFSHNSYSSGGYFGAGHVAGSLLGGLFKFILFLIIIVVIIRIIKKSKRY